MAHVSNRLSRRLTYAAVSAAVLAVLAGAAYAQVGAAGSGAAPAAGGYGPAGSPNVSPSYLGTQSSTSWRAAACARDPRFCTNAPYNGYLGPNLNYTPGSGGSPGTMGYGSTLNGGYPPPYGMPPYGNPYATPYGSQGMGPYGMPNGPAGYGVAPQTGYGAPGYGYGFPGYGMNPPPMGNYGPSFGYPGQMSNTSYGPSSANPSNTQSGFGAPAAGGYSYNSGFPPPGALGGSSTLGNNGGLSNNGSSGPNSNGRQLNNGGLSNLVKGVDQNTLNTVAAQLGMSGDQLNSLRTQATQGALGPDQIQQLAARFGALNLSTNQITTIGHTLGLDPGMMGQIQQMLASASGSQGMPAFQSGMGSFGMPPSGMTPSNPAMPMSTTPLPGQMGMASGPNGITPCPYGMMPNPALTGSGMMPSAMGMTPPAGGLTPPGGMAPGGLTAPSAGYNGMPAAGAMGAMGTPNAMGQNGMPLGTSGMMGMSPLMNGYVCIPSPIEARFQQIDNPFDVPQPPSTDNLVQFGYNFFYFPGAATFAPVGNIPVGNDYVLGPGDEIDILLWGRVNTVLNPVVDRQGMIQVSELGPIQVAGLTFEEAKKLIEAKASKITGVQVDVTMGQLRTINITVAGDVTQPGAYQISALSRVSNALVAAGGVSKVGSLRNIEVRHGNQLIDVVDMYDILLHGNNSSDRRLEEGDVIFVPVIGGVVGIAGDVKRPAIYELKKDHTETLDAALKLGGGISGFGLGDRVQVERVQEHKRLIALDVGLKGLTNQHFTIHDGDIIKVYPVLPGRVNTVTLSGNVRRPGEYQWYKGMRVSDLVKKGEGILPNTYFKYALIRRLSGPEKVTHFFQVDLGDALTNPRNGQGDVALQPKDELDIYNLDDIRDMPSVAVNGEVRLPGRFVFNPQMKVSDLVYMAGGLRDDAYQDRVVLVRTEVSQGGKALRKHIDVDLKAILKGNYDADMSLQPNDELFIRSIVDWQRPPQSVEINGEVRIPGIYDYYPGMRVSDLVALAGGTADDAYLKRAELARTEVVNGSLTRHSYIDVDLRPQYKGPNDKSILLKPNDELLVKAASNYHLPFTVIVNGKVMRPGVYTIREGERLSSLLERCGGFLPDAFVQGIVFRRASVQMMEQERLDEARQRLTKEAANAALTQAQLASAGTTATATSNTSSMSMLLLQNALASTQNQQAQGRMVIHVNSVLENKSSPDDVVLEDGDQIDVPQIPSSVFVMGEVNYPSSFLRIGSDTVRDYINKAGGYTQYADRKNVLVIKADGSVLTTDGYDQSRRSKLFPALPLISGGLMEAKLDVGDTVFVPEDLTSIQDLQKTKDITTIIANSAQGLAVIGLLATQL